MIKLLKKIFKKETLCRKLQNNASENILLYGDCIEFGQSEKNEKSFYNYFKLSNNVKLHFSDIFKKKNKNYFLIDLEKKNIIKKKFDNIIIMNVLEHIFDVSNALDQLKKLLKKNGRIIISTPFLYRYHNAPSDYQRYTINFYEKMAKKKNLKIIYKKNLGHGPFVTSFSMIYHFINLIPFLHTFIFFVCKIIDMLLDQLFKNNLSNIYPVAIFIILKK